MLLSLCCLCGVHKGILETGLKLWESVALVAIVASSYFIKSRFPMTKRSASARSPLTLLFSPSIPSPPLGNQMPQFSRNSRISHRGFAVDLSSRLITEAWPWVSSEDVGEGPRGVDSKDGGGRMMLDLVVARAWDRAPTVRRVYLPVGVKVYVSFRRSRNPN